MARYPNRAGLDSLGSPYVAAILVMLVQAMTVIVLYRRGSMPSRAPEIGNNIRRLRFEHGEMTQDQLAKQAGVTRHTIMALEALKYFPSLLLAFASLASLEYPSSGSSNITANN